MGQIATEQYFPVVLFIMLYTVVLTFESVTIQKEQLMNSNVRFTKRLGTLDHGPKKYFTDSERNMWSLRFLKSISRVLQITRIVFFPTSLLCVEMFYKYIELGLRNRRFEGLNLISFHFFPLFRLSQWYDQYHSCDWPNRVP